MYNEFFGFKEKPFNVTPDPRFLYLSPAHQEALATMIYGIKERRGFVSVIGEIGTGKTTLLHTLFDELGNDVQTAFIFNTKINFRQLMHNILIELELTPGSTNKALLLNQLNDFLIKKLALNEIVALIIDEAQNLSSSVLEELRMLSNLETTKHKLLQILLVGQPELDAKLRNHNLRQLKQRIGINCYLTPLNREEQKKYIEHRLNIAGRSVQQIFSEPALELIFKSSKGIPRIINILCDNALLSAYSKGIRKIDKPILEEIISEYERNETPIEPINEKAEATANHRKPKKSKKMVIAALILLLALQSLLIGIFLYRNKFNSLSQILNIFSPNSSVLSQQNTSPPEQTDELATDEKKNESPTLPQQPLNTLEPVRVTEQTPIEQILARTEKTSTSIPAEGIPAVEITVPDPSPPLEKKLISVSAREGDIVSALALVEYGTINDTLIDIVRRANPDIPDLNLIEIGQTINLPTLDITNFILENENGFYTIHHSTFSAYANALRLHRKLEGKNYPSSITPVRVLGKDSWYRVTVGDFNSFSAALEYAKNTKLDGSIYQF